MPHGRSFSYSRPTADSVTSSRSLSRDGPVHRLPHRPSPMRRPLIRRTSRNRSRSFSPWRRRHSFSRLRSRSRSPARRNIGNGSPPRGDYSPRRRSPVHLRRHSRSRSRGKRRISRSRVRKPLQGGDKPARQEPLNTLPSPSKILVWSKHDNTKVSMFETPEPGEIPNLVSTSNTLPTPRKIAKFASPIKLSDAILSALKSPPQTTELPARNEATEVTTQEPALTDNSVTTAAPIQAACGSHSPLFNEAPAVLDCLRHAKDAIVQPAPLAYPRDAYINASDQPNSQTPSPDLKVLQTTTQREIHECIQEFAQAFTSMVKSKIDADFHDVTPGWDEEISRNGTKPDYQAYCDSATRRCERMVTAIVNGVTRQASKTVESTSSMQGVEYDDSHYMRLEQRIRVLEQQRLDEAALITRIEKNMEMKLDQMIESRLAKRFKAESSEPALPSNKRKRLNISPVSTALFFDEEIPQEINERRVSQLGDRVAKWEQRFIGTFTGKEHPVVLEDGKRKSLVERVSALEDDSKQVFGYLSVHHTALVSMNSALSLDPSKPLGQEVHQRLSELRAEITQTLTELLGSLEESLARVIVGVIVKQTKLEMQASYETFSRELSGKLAPPIQPKKKESVQPPMFQAITPEMVLPAIRELPSMKK